MFLLPRPGAEIPRWTISSDGQRIAVTTSTSTEGASLTIRDRSDATLGTVRIGAIAYPIGFVSDATHVAMQDLHSGELLFIDRRTGAHHRVPGVIGCFVAVDLWAVGRRPRAGPSPRRDRP